VDRSTSKPLGRPLPHQDAIQGATCSPDGQLFLSAGNEGIARLSDREGRLVRECRQGSRVDKVAFSAMGRRF